MDHKKIFEKHKDHNVFIKTTSAKPADKSLKATLNRKGNQLFNSGDVEGARRVFMTTGYSDGLSRVGNYYKSKDRVLEALRMYWLAHDRTKTEPLCEQLAGILQALLHEDEESNNE
jgi:hypothetical protein